MFLRTTEFLWQEGHTAHETPVEARALALEILTDVYAEVMRDIVAVPVFRDEYREVAAAPGDRGPEAGGEKPLKLLVDATWHVVVGSSGWLGPGTAR